MYISFTKRIEVGSYTSKKGDIKPLHHQLRFIDSLKFMATSLASLVNNLSKDAFNNVKKRYAEDKLSLITKKGVYPYDYMDSPEKLNRATAERSVLFYVTDEHSFKHGCFPNEIQYLTTALGRILFSSVVMILAYQPGGPGSSPARIIYFCHAFIHFFLRYELCS